MAKLDLVDWPATVLVTAPSLKDFENVREKYARKYPHVTFGWWPTIPGSYWVSGFSNPSDLARLFSEITSKKQVVELPILMDLELPRKKYFYIKNLFNIGRNKKKIAEFLAKAPACNLKVYTAELPAFSRLVLNLFRAIGISPAFNLPHTKLPMVYSSMVLESAGKGTLNKIKAFEKRFALANPGRIGFGLGTIAVGVLGNEPIISPALLAEDLEWARECGAEEVFIFRLGGLNESYVSIIKNS